MYILAISPGTGWDRDRWAAVLASGVNGLMIRERQLEARALLDLALRARDLAPHLDLWVNGRLDVALASGCGLHAPERHPLPPPHLVPLSRPIHEEDQMQERLGAAQWILSPIHAVPGKGEPWGAQRLHRALDALPPFKGRVLALGGLAPGRVAPLCHPRLDGIALIRALWDATEPRRTVEALRGEW